MKKEISLIAMLLCGSCLFAESAWVNVKNAKILDRESAKGKKIATVDYGTELLVLNSSEKFLQVSLADESEDWTGYVEKKNTTPRKLKTNSSATAKEIALAGKGFSAEAEGLYKSETGLDYSAVDQMERIELSYEEISTFLKDGKLKEAE